MTFAITITVYIFTIIAASATTYEYTFDQEPYYEYEFPFIKKDGLHYSFNFNFNHNISDFEFSKFVYAVYSFKDDLYSDACMYLIPRTQTKTCTIKIKAKRNICIWAKHSKFILLFKNLYKRLKKY